VDFGSTILPEVYNAFGSEIDMLLNPFIYGSTSDLRCFDEASPCLLEQTSFCVIQEANSIAAAQGTRAQDIYVPWLICMDSNGDPISQCNAQVGVSDSNVNACLSDDSALIQNYLTVDAPISGTPTVYINGQDLGSRLTYRTISRALCKADSSLSGCSMAMPNSADFTVERRYKPTDDDVVV